MAALTAAPAAEIPDEALGTVDAGFSADVQFLLGMPAAAGFQKGSCAEASLWLRGSSTLARTTTCVLLTRPAFAQNETTSAPS